MSHADDLPPSDWITRFAPLLRSLAQPAPAPLQALDLACGSGRHTRWLLTQGCHVTAVDRDAAALARLADRVGPAGTTMLTCLEADLENAPWPLPGRSFDIAVVTNYLWRPLLPRIVESVAIGGVLLYETFAQGNQSGGAACASRIFARPG
jgi:SAM-dependent methyltransferase